VKRSSVVQRPRFIFMGNQPFFYNGEAMELPAGGCRIMDPDKLLNLSGIWQWRLGVFYTLNVNSLGQELNY
jgi:hypothetical protein